MGTYTTKDGGIKIFTPIFYCAECSFLGSFPLRTRTGAGDKELVVYVD